MSRKRNKGVVPEPVIKFNESLSKNVHLINIIQNVINHKKMDIFRSYISGYDKRNRTNISEPDLASIYEPYSDTVSPSSTGPVSTSLNIRNGIIKNPKLNTSASAIQSKPMPMLLKLFNLFFKTYDSCVTAFKEKGSPTEAEDDTEPYEKEYKDMNIYDVCDKLPLLKEPDPQPFLFTRTPSSTTYPFDPLIGQPSSSSGYLSQFHNLGKSQFKISHRHTDYFYNYYGMKKLKGTPLYFNTPLEVTPLRARLCPSESYKPTRETLVLYICSHGMVLFARTYPKVSIHDTTTTSVPTSVASPGSSSSHTGSTTSSHSSTSTSTPSTSSQSTRSFHSEIDSDSDDSVTSHNDDETTNQYSVPFIFNNKYTEEHMTTDRPIPPTKRWKTPYLLTESFKNRYSLTTGDPKISQFSRFIQENFIMWPYASLGLHGVDILDTNMLFDLNVIHDVLAESSRIKNRTIQDTLLQTLVYLNGPNKIPGRASAYNLPTSLDTKLHSLWWSMLYRSERGIPIKWNLDVSYGGPIFYDSDRTLLEEDAIKLAKEETKSVGTTMSKTKKSQHTQKFAKKLYNETVMKYDNQIGILYTNIPNNAKYKQFYNKIKELNTELNLDRTVTLLSDIIKVVMDYYPNVQLNIVDFACKGSATDATVDMPKSHFEMSNYIDAAVDQIRVDCQLPIHKPSGTLKYARGKKSRKYKYRK